MMFTFREQAPQGTLYAPGAFASSIGRQIGIVRADGRRVSGRLVAAEVLGIGAAVDLTIEAPDGVLTPPMVKVLDSEISADGVWTVRRFKF